jgi:hypothetical protein
LQRVRHELARRRGGLDAGGTLPAGTSAAGSRALALDFGTVSARRRFAARWCCVTRDALAEAFTASGIEPRRVRMHHTYGLVDVPADRADDAVQALTGSDLAGRTLNVELAREQPAAA